MNNDYEKRGAFYLGREYDLDAGSLTNNTLLYDSKDLITHAVGGGMTGSGKTGLCIDLLEEAAMDGVPSIVIDPQGDIGNLTTKGSRTRALGFWVGCRPSVTRLECSTA